MINLELYRIFYVVARVKNITKASEILNISQPAVTKHIKNLEEQLGNPLFIRTKRGVILNEYGENIFLKVKQSANTLLTPTLPTISIPRSPSPTASALISLASNSNSLSVYLITITSPIYYIKKNSKTCYFNNKLIASLI